MQASSRVTGSYPSHRPGVTHLEDPAIATPIRFGSGAPSFRGSERSDSRGRERRNSRNSRIGSRSASAQGITEIPPDVGTSDAVVRMMPAGPEEARDWGDTLECVANSIAPKERHHRTVAQVTATDQERLAVIESKSEAPAVDGETTRAYLAGM